MLKKEASSPHTRRCSPPPPPRPPAPSHLEVPVHDVHRVQVLQREHELRRVQARALLREDAVPLEPGGGARGGARSHAHAVRSGALHPSSPEEQLAARRKIGDQVQLLARLEAVSELHNERVIHRLQNGALGLGVVDLVPLEEHVLAQGLGRSNARCAPIRDSSAQPPPYLHRVHGPLVFTRAFANEEDLSKTAFTKDFDELEIFDLGQNTE